MTEREMMRKKAARKARARKQRNRRVLVTALLMMAVCVASIGGTIAWLTDSSEQVTNVFSPSTIDIWMTETAKNEEGNTVVKSTKDGSFTNSGFKMVPGGTIAKDPKVHVGANSEACWLFVKIEKSVNFGSFMDFDVATGWTELTEGTGIYWRKVGTSTEDQTFPVIADNTISVLGEEVTKDMMDALAPASSAGAAYPELNFTAYAIQQASFDTATNTDAQNAAAAWAELTE